MMKTGMPAACYQGTRAGNGTSMRGRIYDRNFLPQPNSDFLFHQGADHIWVDGVSHALCMLPPLA